MFREIKSGDKVRLNSRVGVEHLTKLGIPFAKTFIVRGEDSKMLWLSDQWGFIYVEDQLDLTGYIDIVNPKTTPAQDKLARVRQSIADLSQQAEALEEELSDD